ncbi:MAG: enoyl-CoA hydratase/isomerase family protein [Deltaproteobacteria bacterium]|nr:enoyl-CoA hydratase/isomerase family protein [Deltaproteobacteria bacterium]
MNETVLLGVHDGVATVTLNRPDRLNAIDLPTLEALCAALDRAAADSDVRCVVFAGAGRAFCAGADQAEMVPRSPLEWERIVERYLDPIRRISTMDQPVIARLHGDAVGGGLGLALACDYRIAARGVRLCAPFVKIGLAGCDMSAGYFLPRLVGLGRATDLTMSGRFVGAEEAERIGLVTRTVEPEALDGAVAELAGALAASPPRAMAFTKRAIRRSLDRGMTAEFDYEVHAQVQCLQSGDHREALSAFREKRPGRFGGR